MNKMWYDLSLVLLLSVRETNKRTIITAWKDRRFGHQTQPGKVRDGFLKEVTFSLNCEG